MRQKKYRRNIKTATTKILEQQALQKLIQISNQQQFIKSKAYSNWSPQKNNTKLLTNRTQNQIFQNNIDTFRLKSAVTTRNNTETHHKSIHQNIDLRKSNISCQMKKVNNIRPFIIIDDRDNINNIKNSNFYRPKKNSNIRIFFQRKLTQYKIENIRLNQYQKNHSMLIFKK